MEYIRRSIWDIEVNSPNKFPKPEEALHPISSITIYDSFTNHYFSLALDTKLITSKKQQLAPDWDAYFFPKETDVCINTIKLVQSLDPDTFEGFFSRTFDFPYIFNRFTSLGLNPSNLSSLGYVSNKNGKFKVSGRHILDIVDMDKKFKKRTSYSLKNIAEDEQLSVKKMEVDLSSIHATPLQLVEYNKVDVEVSYKLDLKMQHLKRYVARWNLAGLEDIDSCLHNSVVIDAVILREAKKRSIVLPSKPERVETEKKEDVNITGGIVFEPIIGIHDNVMVFDMSRFYPSMIVSLRLSPENISENGTIIAADGTKYIDNPNALLPAIISQFSAERDRIQGILKNVMPDSQDYQKLVDEDENAKFLLNAIFGVTGHKGFRLYEPRITNSITQSCQKMIKHAKEFIESKGYIVIGGDTDSIFIKVIPNKLEEIIDIGLSLTTKLNKMFPIWMKEDFNVEAISLKIAFDKIFSRLVFISTDKGDSVKKRYFGRLIWTMK